MKLNPEELLKVIGKQTVMIELLQAQLKEAREYNQSGTEAATATEISAEEVR